MSWNYRVVRENGVYGIREVHYDLPRPGEMMWTDGTGILNNWDRYEDLNVTYDLIREAFKKPVLLHRCEVAKVCP